MMQKYNKSFSGIQGQKVFSFPVIKVPLKLYQILLKIASHEGVPLETLAVSQLEKFAINRWDVTEKNPKSLEAEHDPRSTIG